MVHSAFAKKEAALQERLQGAEAAQAQWRAAAEDAVAAQAAAEQAAALASRCPAACPIK